MAESSVAGYKIVSTLGFGAKSEIYLAIEPLTKREVAVKSVKRESADDDKYIHQVENEYNFAFAFDHINIVRIFDLIKLRSLFRLRRCLLVMEYVDGTPLSHLFQPELGTLVDIFVQTAEGLSYIHDLRLVHADVKPNNIMIRKDGRVKLIDFGLVGFDGKRRGRVQGTMDYAAPEQVREKVYDVKTDIYNFGATMYRTLTGQHVPSRAMMSGRVRLDKFKLFPPSHFVRTVPEELDDLVLRTCAMDRDARPDTMQEILDGLRKTLTSMTTD